MSYTRQAKQIVKKILGYSTTNEHWCRVVMNQETERIVNTLDIGQLNVLEISGKKWSNLPFKSYQNLQYPQFDICENIPNNLGKFDLIIAEQVFEHLKYPYKAAKNIYSLLNPNGSFLITTPFLIKRHDVPIDCNRWSAIGMKYFLEECGFNQDKITSDSWGNRKCVIGNFNKWPLYNKYFHSLKNEPEFPIVVWAIAKK